MTTENSASNSASVNGNAHSNDRSTLASKVKLRKLATAKTQQTVKVNTKASASSEYFALNSRSVGEKLVCKRKRAGKTVPRAADAEISNTSGNDVSPAVDCRPLRGKRQNLQTAKEAVKREAHEKGDESELMPTTEIDILVSNRHQQSCNENCYCAAEASLDENNSTSSSDVDWEDVEGRSLILIIK